MGSWTSGADDTSVPDASAEGNSGQASPAGGSYEAGRLPLLAYALQQTWQRREGRRLTVWVTERRFLRWPGTRDVLRDRERLGDVSGIDGRCECSDTASGGIRRWESSKKQAASHG